jgi:hypothetical protein
VWRQINEQLNLGIGFLFGGFRTGNQLAERVKVREAVKAGDEKVGISVGLNPNCGELKRFCRQIDDGSVEDGRSVEFTGSPKERARFKGWLTPPPIWSNPRHCAKVACSQTENQTCHKPSHLPHPVPKFCDGRTREGEAYAELKMTANGDWRLANSEWRVANSE